MSAYVVSKHHIDHLVQAALAGCLDTEGRWSEYGEFGWVYDGRYRRLLGPGDLRADGTSSETLTPSQFGQLLLSENIRSVEGRYPDLSAEAGDLPGCDAYYWIPYVFEPVMPDEIRDGRLVRVGVCRVLTCSQLINALRGYCYQSCECDDWLQSEAYAIITALRETLLAHLPGVEEADGWAL
jgi:hypothetical protein